MLKKCKCLFVFVKLAFVWKIQKNTYLCQYKWQTWFNWWIFCEKCFILNTVIFIDAALNISLRKFWKCNVLWFYSFGQDVPNETKGKINFNKQIGAHKMQRETNLLFSDSPLLLICYVYFCQEKVKTQNSCSLFQEPNFQCDFAARELSMV